MTGAILNARKSDAKESRIEWDRPAHSLNGSRSRRPVHALRTRPFAFREKLLGYFCDKDLRKLCWWFCLGWQNSGSPSAAHKRSFAHAKERESGRDLWAVYGRFGPKYKHLGSRWATCAIYANRARPHKHWLFRILLILRVGT